LVVPICCCYNFVALGAKQASRQTTNNSSYYFNIQSVTSTAQSYFLLGTPVDIQPTMADEKKKGEKP
jgi:hypothetical protein